MMNFGIAFAPLLPPVVLWTGAAIALAIALLLLLARPRGALLRILALALLLLALTNPSFTREDRDPVPSVAAAIVGPSMPGSEYGTPTSTRSQPDSTSAVIAAIEVGTSGNPVGR